MLGSVLAAGLLLPAASLCAQTVEELLASGRLVVQTRVEPEQVLVGQRVTLSLELLTATWFPAPPRFPETIGGKDLISLPGVRGPNINRRVGGISLNGVSRVYELYPVAPGRLQTGAATLSAVVATEGAARSPELELRIEPQAFVAELPEQARGLGLVLAAPELRVGERWRPERTQLEVGDALERTVTLEVRDSVSVLLPELGFPAPDGVGAYRGRSEASDERQRGVVEGRRLQSVNYVMERPGRFELPEETIAWWNTERGRLERVVLPARRLEVEPAPEPLVELGVDEEPSEAALAPVAPQRRQWPRALLAAAGVGLLLAWWWTPRLRAWWRRLSELRRPRVEERQLYAAVTAAARSGNAAATLRSLLNWLDHVWPYDGIATLDALCGTYGDRLLCDELSALQAAVHGSGDASVTWKGDQLLRAIETARRRMRRSLRTEVHALGPLNPGNAGR